MPQALGAVVTVCLKLLDVGAGQVPRIMASFGGEIKLVGEASCIAVRNNRETTSE